MQNITDTGDRIDKISEDKKVHPHPMIYATNSTLETSQTSEEAAPAFTQACSLTSEGSLTSPIDTHTF